MKEIAEAIGRNLNIPVKRLSGEEAQTHFGFFAQSLMFDNPTSADGTRKLLGWSPAQATLINDIDNFYASRT